MFDILEFIKSDELEAFITGPAGSGKTTILKDIVNTLNENKINFIITAYTKTACKNIESKVPNTEVQTLHSFLKKRPTLNEFAKKLNRLKVSIKTGDTDVTTLLIVDEFSFIGERDYFDIGESQDELNLTKYICKKCNSVTKEIEDCVYKCVDCDDILDSQDVNEIKIPPLKVLYIGDLNQLPPVNDILIIQPREPFWLKLTKIHRINDSNTLHKPLQALVEMIETNQVKKIPYTEDMIKVKSFKDLYVSDNHSKIILAYTNHAVQKHNIDIQGYKFPEIGDMIYSPTENKSFELQDFKAILVNIKELKVPRFDDTFIDNTSKYNPLKYLAMLKFLKYFKIDGYWVAGIFGCHNSKLIYEEYGNKVITKNKKGLDSKIDFRNYKLLNDLVYTFDFTHCKTVHKAQGSEYDNVYIDLNDINKCKDTQNKLKLLYVAFSRSKNKIIVIDS